MVWPDEELFTKRELAHWLAFSQLSGPGIGVAKIMRLYEHFNSLEPVWHSTPGQLRQLQFLTKGNIDAFMTKRDTIDPLELLKIVESKGVKAYPIMHPRYPYPLREIADPPLVLYMLGELNPDDLRYAVSVVGTRHPTQYGHRLAKQIASGLSGSGATVVSGLALGIDSLAHWGAIEGGGRTVAVLPSGVDICYPSSNKPLYARLSTGENGAVVSEFFPGTKPKEWHFPARNRIVAGLSQAVVVVEAGETSGSLITARIAFEQSRSIYAVPGRLDSPMSRGCNQIIAETKAKLLLDYTDIFKDLNWVASPIAGREVPTVVQLFGRERDLYELITGEPVHFDVLCERTGMNAGELSATLTMLELAGVVSRHPGDWYSRSKDATTISGAS